MGSSSSGIELTLRLADLSQTDPLESRQVLAQVVPLFRLPLLAEWNGTTVLCDASRLPFRDRSFDLLRIGSTPGFLIDEARFFEECFRIIQSGGRFAGSAPNSLGLGHLDTVNFVRYLKDVFKKGPPLPEVLESGWRKHYSPAELCTLLKSAGFQGVTINSSGVLSNEIRTAWRLTQRARGRQANSVSEISTLDGPEKAIRRASGLTGSTLDFLAYRP